MFVQHFFISQLTGSLMKKALNLPHLIFYGTGMILGAGIYSIIGKAAGVSGQGLWLSFLLAAFGASLTALSYAELATMFPRTGAEFIYLKNIFPRYPFLAMFCGSTMIFAGISTATTVTMAFSGYLQQFVEVPQFISSISLLAIMTAVNIVGVKESSWVNIFLTLIEVSGLVLFVYIGAQSPQFGQAFGKAEFDGSVVSGASLVIFAYFGFETIVNLVEETKNPEKQMPKGIIISIIVSTVLYLLVSLAALALGSPEEMQMSDAPLSDLSKKSYPWIPKTLAGIALFSTANTALISMMSTTRIIFSMAREKELPATFTRMSEKRQTPWFSAITVFVLATVLLPLGKIEVVASTTSLATMVAFSLINIGLIRLRFTEPQAKRPFKVPFSIKGFPVLAYLAALISILLIFFFVKEVYFISAFVFLMIGLVYKFR